MALVIQKQQMLNWCWAAVAVSVARHYFEGVTWTQCTFAWAMLNRAAYDSGDQAHCCGSDDPPECDKPFSLEQALRGVRLRPQVLSGPMKPFSAVHARLKAGCPIPVMIDWGKDQGHFVVLTDCKVTRSGVEKVFVGDPFFISAWVSYSDFLAGYQPDTSDPAFPSRLGSWSLTYLV
jgi:hypothetical protein